MTKCTYISKYEWQNVHMHISKYEWMYIGKYEWLYVHTEVNMND